MKALAISMEDLSAISEMVFISLLLHPNFFRFACVCAGIAPLLPTTTGRTSPVWQPILCRMNSAVSVYLLDFSLKASFKLFLSSYRTVTSITYSLSFTTKSGFLNSFATFTVGSVKTVYFLDSLSTRRFFISSCRLILCGFVFVQLPSTCPRVSGCAAHRLHITLMVGSALLSATRTPKVLVRNLRASKNLDGLSSIGSYSQALPILSFLNSFRKALTLGYELFPPFRFTPLTFLSGLLYLF